MQPKIDQQQFARIVSDFVAAHRLAGFIHVADRPPELGDGDPGDCWVYRQDKSTRFYALKSERTGWERGGYVNDNRQIFERLQLAVRRQQAAGER